VAGKLFSRENFRRIGRAIHLVGPVFKRYRLRLVFGFAALVSVNFFLLFIPRVIKHAIDSLEKGTATRTDLFYFALTISALALGVACFRFAWRYLILGFSRLLERDVRVNMLSHLLTLDRLFFQKRSAGEIMALATNDLAAVQLATGMGLVAFADAVFMTLATLGFMAYINPALTLIAMVPLPLLAVLTSILTARLHRRFKKVQEQFSRLTEFARTNLASIRLIKAYTLEPAQTNRFDGMGRVYVKNNLKLAMLQGTLFPVSSLLANTSMLLVLYFGGRLTIQSVISLGDFVAFISYLYMLTWPTMALGWVANLFQRGVTSLDRLQAVFEAQPTLKSPDKPAGLSITQGKIRIDGLTFCYQGQTVPALKEVSLTIQPGVLGVVGRTGSGKTTLCQLIARVFPIPDQTVFIDDTDINRLALKTVRAQIAYVPQDVTLFADTMAANIAFGKPGASQEEIEGAAKAAAIHEEIMAMASGYETRVGERGMTISGGQRQRISLARALLLDRPILIIDDGLSAVDMQTEHAIIQSISKYLTGRTCIIVSHRVAPLADANEIIVFEKGQIVARGPHQELLKTSEFYKTIYEHQVTSKECGANGL
jgi:ATP-binding cassette subfamily B protein